MAGLDALKSYGSDIDSSSESDDGVPDESIPTSRQEPGFKNQVQKRSPTAEISTLPLPGEILSMFSSPSSETSNPIEHQGRIRSFAHTPGNWATFVYIPAETPSLSSLTETLISCLPQDLTFHPSDDLHLSLSRTVCLQFHWIDPFIQSFRERVGRLRSFRCHVEQVDVYTNDEETRTFLGLKIGAGHEVLCDLVKLADDCLQEFSLPVFYEDPSFHVSFCWCVGDVSSRIGPKVLQELQNKLNNHLGELSVDVREIRCKSGCKKFVIPLR
ncbi:U6 snRNA phosphodiesterase-like [Lytechinus variegatus]|uniref:U6 snRNA phosphodiesterase-like n=1 Tax=Lytechinus variegatus TaxID=7654 RepID=UPI001BB1F4C5|nr:U6 snRNA phosphodiesterase-like [Lytechinus variegatus]